MAAVGLIDLAPELLDLIFGHLCSHCQYGRANVFPEYNTIQDVENQATLAALCLAHSYLRKAAQAILYHFFVLNASYMKINKKKFLESRLTQFIGTVCKRPDLGKNVRALNMVPMDKTYNTWKAMIPAETWKSLPQEDYERFAANQEMSKSISSRHVNGRSVKFGVVSVLLLTLVPDLEYLLYQFGSFHHMLDLVKPIPKLRVLQLMPVPGSMLLGHQLRGVFRVFPNIQALSASDAAMSCDHHYNSHSDQPRLCDHSPWDMLPRSLRKITWDSAGITSLARIFDHCLRLEDLEITLYINMNWSWDIVPPPNGAFEKLRGILRRLVFTSQYSQAVPRLEDFEFVTAGGGLVARTRLSLRQFERLEILEIGQTYLHAELRRHTEYSANQLSAVLPESLKALHIGYVVAWPLLQEQLQELAQAKSSGRFKNLSIIQIDLWPLATNRPDEDEVTDLSSVLASGGIRFFCGIANTGGRRMLPSPPGTEEAIHYRPEFTL